MRTIVAQVFAAFIAAATIPAHAAVGFQHFSIGDPQGPPIEVGVWYPTGAAPTYTPVQPQISAGVHSRCSAVSPRRIQVGS